MCGLGAFLNLDLIGGFGFQGEVNYVANQISTGSNSVTFTHYEILDFPLYVWYNLKLNPIVIGAGAGINIMLNSDNLYYSWAGGQDNYAYSEFLGTRKPSANIAAELCAAVTFGKFELSLRYTDFGLHSDEVQEYYASKTQIYDIAPNHIIKSTNIYAARYYAVSLTVGYAF